ncbi:MAG: hypothetical protein M3O02_12405 [Acidobacteriota bacterium]|nr:hypothetical protein [Acidobacteriota bacterium]
MSNLVLESILSSFDSQAELTWDLVSHTEATASFVHSGDKVTVTFLQTSPNEWRASFDVSSNAAFTGDKARSSIRIFSGVFQAVEEFLTIRQPERLVFASKEEGLGRLYETYLERQDSNLHALGYQSEYTTKASPLAEYAIIKTTPTAWSTRSS